MSPDSRARRICINIYQCRKAANFLNATALPPYRDRCGCCASTATLFDFTHLGMILHCPICTVLSGVQPGTPQPPATLLADCVSEQGRHCRLCALEYSSIRGQKEEWVGKAAALLRCFLGAPPRDLLAKDLYGLCVNMGCSELRKLIAQTLEMLTEERRLYLESRIVEASRLFDFELLSKPSVPSMKRGRLL